MTEAEKSKLWPVLEELLIASAGIQQAAENRIAGIEREARIIRETMEAENVRSVALNNLLDVIKELLQS